MRVRQFVLLSILGYAALLRLKSLRRRKRRRWWVRPVYQDREKGGFYETTFQIMKSRDPEMFVKTTRMNLESFNVLFTCIGDKLQKYSFRKPISAECRLLLTLIYLAHGGPRHIYALKFKMSTSIVGRIIYETCKVLWDYLSEIYISPPNCEEWKLIAEHYERKWGLPHCLGAIDGKHVNIVCPPNGGSQYFNFKGRHSIVLLAVCDANYCFTMVDIGAYGSQSDGGILAESSFGKLLFGAKLQIPSPSTLPSSDETFPYFFVGDSAFPLHTNLMRPFTERNTSTPQERNFNNKISRARVTVENTFGVLASRWRVLRNDIHALPANVDYIIKAAVVLHNFLMLTKCAAYCPTNYVDSVTNDEIVAGQWRNENIQFPTIPPLRTHNFPRERYILRQKLCTYLCKNI